MVREHRLVPLPLDISFETLAPDVRAIEAATTPKTCALVIAHLWFSFLLFQNTVPLTGTRMEGKALSLVTSSTKPAIFPGFTFSGLSETSTR